jgi:uncharacterized membrane protein YgcG
MLYSHAIILTLVLIVIFCCFFGWCLYKSCWRIIDAEVQVYQLETQHAAAAAAVAAAATERGSAANGSGSKSGENAGGSKSGGNGGGSKSGGNGGGSKNGAIASDGGIKWY